MQKAVHQLAVIGKQKQAFTVIVQSAYRKKPYGEITETVQNCRTAFRIRDRRNLTDRFIVCDIVFFGFGTNGFTVYGHDIRKLIHLCTQFSDSHSVNRDMTAGNQFFSIPPGSNAAGGKVFLKTH